MGVNLSRILFCGIDKNILDIKLISLKKKILIFKQKLLELADLYIVYFFIEMNSCKFQGKLFD